MKIVNLITFVLVIIGALNWSLVGLVDINLVSIIFGTTILTKVVYFMIGLSGLYMITRYKDVTTE